MQSRAVRQPESVMKRAGTDTHTQKFKNRRVELVPESRAWEAVLGCLEVLSTNAKTKPSWQCKNVPCFSSAVHGACSYRHRAMASLNISPYSSLTLTLNHSFFRLARACVVTVTPVRWVASVHALDAVVREDTLRRPFWKPKKGHG